LGIVMNGLNCGDEQQQSFLYLSHRFLYTVHEGSKTPPSV
jgi:hypothetical protein